MDWGTFATEHELAQRTETDDAAKIFAAMKSPYASEI